MQEEQAREQVGREQVQVGQVQVQGVPEREREQQIRRNRILDRCFPLRQHERRTCQS